jgi:hypothetical protein
LDLFVGDKFFSAGNGSSGSPVLGIATHLDSKALSPDVDWRALMEQASKQIREEVSVAKCS